MGAASLAAAGMTDDAPNTLPDVLPGFAVPVKAFFE